MALLFLFITIAQIMYLNKPHGLSEQFMKYKYLKSAHFNAEHIIKHFRTQSTEFNKMEEFDSRLFWFMIHNFDVHSLWKISVSQANKNNVRFVKCAVSLHCAIIKCSLTRLYNFIKCARGGAQPLIKKEMEGNQGRLRGICVYQLSFLTLS